jgi:hypothetical protein
VLPGTGFFTNGATTPTAYADFDASYQPINGLDGQDTASRYTVQDGDTLQSIAQQIWGDSNFWYLIADANGLNGSSQLTTGMDLIIPNKVANVSNSNSTYRVYDPNLYVGDTSPTHPPKPQHHHNCGMMGEILVAVVAIAVAYFTAGALLGPLASFAGSAGGLGLSTAGTAAAIGGTAVSASSAAGIVGAAAAGAIGGAVGSVVSQGVGLATGIQSKFDWGAVGLAAIGGAVGGGLQGAGAFNGFSGSSFIDGAMRGAVSSIATQGIGVATGLQSKFDWAGVAGAAVGGGVTNAINANWSANISGQPVLSAAATSFVSGMAGGIANAAARTLINGSDFGDNIIAALPDVIANTVGSAIAAQEQLDELASAADPHAAAQRILASVVNDRDMTANDQTAADQLSAAIDAAQNTGPSPEQSAQLDAAIRNFLNAVATTPQEQAAVKDYEGLVFGTPGGGGSTDPNVETAVVDGNPNSLTYFVSHTVDDAGIWAGKLENSLDTTIGDFLNQHSGAAIALNVASIGLTVAGGPARFVASQVFDLAKDGIRDWASGGYQNAGWDANDASLGGSGMVFAGSVILGGLGALRTGITIRNLALAGKNHPVTGIPFNEHGFPDFSSVAVKTVKIQFTGSNRKDFDAANLAVGLDETPAGYTWHHVEDGTTMQLVPTDTHAQTGHTGGMSLWKYLFGGN